jgi:DNA-binding Xre family transcriptional regulator
MTNKKSTSSTFERMMQNDEFKNEFEKGYKEFIISELILALMKGDNISVRKLSKEAGISTSIIQEIRAGKKGNITIKTFYNILNSLGCEIQIKRKSDNTVFPLIIK